MAGAREVDLDPDKRVGLTLPLGRSSQGFFNQSKTTLEQVKHNIVNLLLTYPGERPGEPELGSRLREIVFEPMDDDLGEKIEEEINSVMERWLPYITIGSIDVNFSDRLENTVDVSMTVSVNYDPERFDEVNISLSGVGTAAGTTGGTTGGGATIY